MNIIETMLTVLYGVTGFGTFLRLHFLRELALKRTYSSLVDINQTVRKALQEVRTTFDSLFKNDTARETALAQFPMLQDAALAQFSFTETSKYVDGYVKILCHSLVWPITIPMYYSDKIVDNIVKNEQREQEAQRESYDILAEHEEYAPLAEAFRSGDDERIQRAIIAKAEREAEYAEAARISPELVIHRDESKAWHENWNDACLETKAEVEEQAYREHYELMRALKRQNYKGKSEYCEDLLADDKVVHKQIFNTDAGLDQFKVVAELARAKAEEQADIGEFLARLTQLDYNDDPYI